MEESLWNDNMKIIAVTTYNNKLYKEYAHRFEKTYNWDFPYTVYNEDDGMLEAIPECKAFVERNKHRFEGKDFVKDYWQDGVRFCYKVYAYTHAILNEDADGLICIDADSVFYKKIDAEWVKKHIHRDDHMMTYLGRGKHYSECGFLYFNLRHPQVKNYAKDMQQMYDTDEIYKLIGDPVVLPLKTPESTSTESLSFLCVVIFDCPGFLLSNSNCISFSLISIQDGQPSITTPIAFP